MAVLVREYRESDLHAIRRIHAASGIDYALPDFESPLFVAKLVVERAGIPTSMIAGKIDVETYLWPSGDPRSKWEDIELLNSAYARALWEKGANSCYAAVPPDIAKHFGKRMVRLGWSTARNWPIFTRDLL